MRAPAAAWPRRVRALQRFTPTGAHDCETTLLCDKERSQVCAAATQTRIATSLHIQIHSFRHRASNILALLRHQWGPFFFKGHRASNILALLLHQWEPFFQILLVGNHGFLPFSFSIFVIRLLLSSAELTLPTSNIKLNFQPNKPNSLSQPPT